MASGSAGAVQTSTSRRLTPQSAGLRGMRPRDFYWRFVPSGPDEKDAAAMRDGAQVLKLSHRINDDRPGAIRAGLPYVQLLLPAGFSILRCASSSAFFILRVSAPWEGGKSISVFRCAAMNGPAAVGAHSFEAKNLRPM